MVEVTAFMASWITPTSVFVLLNVVIATIAVNSSFGTRKQRQHHYQLAKRPPPFAPAPSPFSRVTSFNFSRFHVSEEVGQFISSTARPEPTVGEKSTQPPPFARAPSLLSRDASFDFSQHRSVHPGTSHPSVENLPPRDSSPACKNVVPGRNKEGGGGRAPDAWSRGNHVTRTNSGPSERPTLAADRSGKAKMKKSASENSLPPDEEVDAKADDFIKRFRQQLKLQRLESLVHYKNAPTAP
ncbi:hypothetical protein Nepgr_019918 [Nepenthes gracilis]|uniref:DUF4408 domain-containing protein n=1 Tax=Nepenthes gracilis TaxID=150966 RepID=A0AAD3SWX3_NEPGR|nr:hypothetical protein Nepgr_019918 [Nepenthes gracilis]